MLNKETLITSLKLFIITAVAAFCLATVNKITLPIITENNAAAETKAQQDVLPSALEFIASEAKQPEDSTVTIEKMAVGLSMNGDGRVAGYVVTAVSNAGYGGNIKVMVGINKDLEVNRIKIMESSETAGLGANASKPMFADQFIGAKNRLSVVKGEAGKNEISAIASATITSKAVTSCVNAAIEAAQAKAADNKVEETVQKLEEIKQETAAQLSEEVEK